MKTDGVVFGTLTPYRDHTHLNWVCPDCGTSGYFSGENGFHRLVCSETGRVFLVVGIADGAAVRHPFGPHRRLCTDLPRHHAPERDGSEEHEQSTTENRSNGKSATDVLD